MATTPTTKTQVQGYRFGLRRMQSALVGRDANMLHEPVRKHSRATAVGVLLAIVGMLAFLVVGFFKPQPKLDGETQIAISKESGQVYVVSSNPRQLIPMTNLASARLFWFQQTNPDAGSSPTANAGGDAPAGAISTSQQAAGGTPKVVSEAALSKLSKGRLTGIPDGPDLLPSAERRIGAEWSVCDTLDLDGFRKDQSAENDISTTVVAGVNGGDKALEGNRALLVQSVKDKKGYLIYKAAASTVRAQVDLSDDATKAALKLSGKKPRAISAALLNAIPEVKPLKAPAIPGQGGPARYLQGVNVKIGEVVQVTRTGDVEFYVVLEDGLQLVEKTVGDLIQFANAGSKKPADLSPSVIANALEPKNKLDVEDYPREVPQVLEANADNVVVCSGLAGRERQSGQQVREHQGHHRTHVCQVPQTLFQWRSTRPARQVTWSTRSSCLRARPQSSGAARRRVTTAVAPSTWSPEGA